MCSNYYNLNLDVFKLLQLKLENPCVDTCTLTIKLNIIVVAHNVFLANV